MIPVVKIYLSLWALWVLIVIGIYAIGLLSPLVAAFFGLVAITLCFMGMLSIVPALLAHEDEDLHQ